jgi:hypothetical protein
VEGTMASRLGRREVVLDVETEAYWRTYRGPAGEDHASLALPWELGVCQSHGPCGWWARGGAETGRGEDAGWLTPLRAKSRGSRRRSTTAGGRSGRSKRSRSRSA